MSRSRSWSREDEGAGAADEEDGDACRLGMRRGERSEVIKKESGEVEVWYGFGSFE